MGKEVVYMEGENRRQKILDVLYQSEKPISGTQLAKMMAVSRQIIVQDIALLRAVDKNILSTNKGYILYKPASSQRKFKRCFQVRHDDTRIRDELYLIVDCGARLLDVVVEHDVYGQIMADLYIPCRKDADDFIRKIESTGGKPLNVLTGGIHYHTVEADSEEILDGVEAGLRKNGFLV